MSKLKKMFSPHMWEFDFLALCFKQIIAEEDSQHVRLKSNVGPDIKISSHIEIITEAQKCILAKVCYSLIRDVSILNRTGNCLGKVWKTFVRTPKKFFYSQNDATFFIPSPNSPIRDVSALILEKINLFMSFAKSQLT